MRTRAKLVLCSLTAALILSAIVGTASAQQFLTTNQGIRVTFPELTFTDRDLTREIICAVTIEGTFHSRTIAKRPELLVGYITRAFVNNERCRKNEVEGVTIQNSSLPWTIRYESFEGALPNITRINLRLILVGFILEQFGIRCLYKSSAASPARGWVNVNAARQATEITARSETQIPRFEGSTLFCSPSGAFNGSGAVRLLGSATTLVFILLI